MKINSQTLVSYGLVSIVLGVCAFDSYRHFDQDLVSRKMERFSPQKDWNLFFSQSQVFYSGSLNITNDIVDLRDVLPRNSLILSDKATSYYLAAHLPVSVLNVHRHHGRYKKREWMSFIDSNRACLLSEGNNYESLARLARKELDNQASPTFLIISKAQGNKNYARDCLSSNRGYLIETAKNFFKLSYENQTFLVFDLSTASAEHN